MTMSFIGFHPAVTLDSLVEHCDQVLQPTLTGVASRWPLIGRPDGAT